MLIILRKIFLIGIHCFCHVNRSDDCPLRQQNLSKATRTAAALKYMSAFKVFPEAFAEAATGTIGAKSLFSERVELGLTILQPLRTKTSGVGTRFYEARNTIDNGESMPVFTR